MDLWITKLQPLPLGFKLGKRRAILIGVLLQTLAIYALYRAIRRGRKKGTSTTNTKVNSKSENVNKDREQGAWTPQSFNYPEIIPCPHALKDTKPVPYRPFRWGEYHVTMGIRTMPWSEWMELDQSFLHHQRIRDFRVRTCGETVLRVLPPREDESVKVVGGAEAVKELLYELAEYLPRRYPSSFRITRLPELAVKPCVGGIPLAWNDDMPVKTIEVVETGVNYDLGVLESMDGVDMGEEAFRIINGLMQDDIAIMIEGSEGKYYFQAGLICVPGFWRMRDKIGMQLDEIHITGEVPQFKEKLQFGMNRFFQRLPLDKPVIRNNYSIQVIQPLSQPDPEASADLTTLEETQAAAEAAEEERPTLSSLDPTELAWSESLNGPEDTFSSRSHASTLLPHLSPRTLHLRSERQTLRRLPRTGAIVFGIRTYQFEVAELVKERGVAGRLASAVRSWPEDVAGYKGRWRWKEVLLAYLDGWAEKDGVSGPGEGMLPYPY